MSESGTLEYRCPVCKKNFYLQQKGFKLYLCSEEQVCYPPDENYQNKNPDCGVHYFCSEQCAEEKLNSISACKPQPGWQKYMTRIGSVSKENGIAGARVHDINKK